MPEKIILSDAAFEYVKSVLSKHPKVKTSIKKGEYSTPDDAVMLELKKHKIISLSPGRYSALTINVPLGQLAGGGTFTPPKSRKPRTAKATAGTAAPGVSALRTPSDRYSYDALATLVETIEPLVDERKAEKSKAIEADIAKLKAHIAKADGDDLSNTATALQRTLKARDALLHASMVEVLDDLATDGKWVALRSVIQALRLDHSAARDSLTKSAAAAENGS